MRSDRGTSVDVRISRKDDNADRNGVRLDEKNAGRNVSSGGKTPRKGARTDVRIGRTNARTE